MPKVNVDTDELPTLPYPHNVGGSYIREMTDSRCAYRCVILPPPSNNSDLVGNGGIYINYSQ